ncbi:MAG: hypothetical protein LUO93_00735 [Methanomicrobiales archaeon]|nr:hypothetical protein [Methanomicrobiales archaeon]
MTAPSTCGAVSEIAARSAYAGRVSGAPAAAPAGWSSVAATRAARQPAILRMHRAGTCCTLQRQPCDCLWSFTVGARG